MAEKGTTLNQGKEAVLQAENYLLKRISECCHKFRTGTFFSDFSEGNDPLTWLSTVIWGLVNQHPESRFVQGLLYIGVPALPQDAMAVFFCLCELFLDKPLAPADASAFETGYAQAVFDGGIEPLVGAGMVIAVAVNNPDESRARKDIYLLSPEVCGSLFRGREYMIRPSIVAQFGTLVPWMSIRRTTLIYPDRLLERISLITQAVSGNRYDQVVSELKEHGLRSGVTALLYGPPGTGKTEFVRQLALTTERNLIQVDCAKLDATYFGEKPRNLRDFFRLARYASAISVRVPIIFVDEADGLLGRRGENLRASDKEENSNVNIILEELNTFSGILLAATNHIANLDPAMSRRFLLKVEFPVPDRAVLVQIWRLKLPWLTEDEAGILAERFPLSAGVIDNVVGLCVLEKIVYGRNPSLEQILRLCESQSHGSNPRKRIGF